MRDLNAMSNSYYSETLALSYSGQELSSLSNDWERRTSNHLTWSLLMTSLSKPL